MTRLVWSCLFCFLLSQAWAAPEPKWPKEVRSLAESDFKAVSGADLPSGVSLYNKGDETLEERARRVVHIASVDLDGDSVPELIVKADLGGSAGVYYDVYRKEPNGYRHLGNLGAGFGIKLLSRAGGFLQIEIWSRGGGGDYVRLLFRFDHGEYRRVRTDDYHGYEGTYLRTRNAN